MGKSYAKLNSKYVIIACDKGIDFYNTKIEKSRNRYIDKELNRRFFKAKCREEAIEKVKKHSPSRPISNWDIPLLTYGSHIEKLSNIKKLAEMSNEVLLSDDDAKHIYEFWPHLKGITVKEKL